MKKLVDIMGGSVIETESERLMCMGAAKMVVELGQDSMMKRFCGKCRKRLGCPWKKQNFIWRSMGNSQYKIMELSTLSLHIL